MKYFIFCTVALLSMNVATAAVTCSNFTGKWAGKCKGKQVGIGGPEKFELSQKACDSLFFDKQELVLDGKVHPFDGGKYLASWDRNLYPKGNHLRISLNSSTAGVQLSVLYLLEEKQVAEKGDPIVITRKTTRSVAGLKNSEEELETCEFGLGKS